MKVLFLYGSVRTVLKPTHTIVRIMGVLHESAGRHVHPGLNCTEKPARRFTRQPTDDCRSSDRIFMILPTSSTKPTCAESQILFRFDSPRSSLTVMVDPVDRQTDRVLDRFMDQWMHQVHTCPIGRDFWYVASQLASQIATQLSRNVATQESRIGRQVDRYLDSQVGSQIARQVGNQLDSQLDSCVPSQLVSCVARQLVIQLGIQVGS